MRSVDEVSLAGARSSEEGYGTKQGQGSSCGMLKAGLGNCHACQRNIQPAKPWKRTTLYEDWVPRAVKCL